jgi:hypothetical protein
VGVVGGWWWVGVWGGVWWAVAVCVVGGVAVVLVGSLMWRLCHGSGCDGLSLEQEEEKINC